LNLTAPENEGKYIYSFRMGKFKKSTNEVKFFGPKLSFEIVVAKKIEKKEVIICKPLENSSKVV